MTVPQVELKTGETYRGTLVEAEDNWNSQMKDITVTGRVRRFALALNRPAFPWFRVSACSASTLPSLAWHAHAARLRRPGLCVAARCTARRVRQSYGGNCDASAPRVCVGRPSD